MNTSNCADAGASNSPFLSVVHPILTRGLNLVGSKLAAEAPVDKLVEQHPHETVSISRSFASSRKAMTCSRVTEGGTLRESHRSCRPLRCNRAGSAQEL